MKFSTKFFGIIVVLVIAFTNSFSQNSVDTFASGGGFKVNLPKTFTSAKDVGFNEEKISGEGKAYTWEKPQDYFFQILYYKLSPNKKTLTTADNNLFLETFRNDFLKEPKENNFPYTEKEYSLNKNKGFEIQVIKTGIKSITRFFVVGQRFYLITMIFNQNQDEKQIVQIMDSFSLLDSKSLLTAKIEEFSPKVLPQEPVATKIKTDAQDKNLKGKVKSVTEVDQAASSKNRVFDSEEYYNEQGNLIKDVSYDEGLPNTVTVWGYIDGQRVSDVNSVSFDDDQRPPPQGMTITALAKDNVKNRSLPRDMRYANRFIYKYNEQDQLIEQQIFQNSGELYSRQVYNYKGNQREELNYGADGSEWGKTIEILDKDGNVIERNLMDAQGKIDTKITSTYEYDAQGNWIVKRDVEKLVIKGKTVMKPLWTSYRTITYYP